MRARKNAEQAEWMTTSALDEIEKTSADVDSPEANDGSPNVNVDLSDGEMQKINKTK